MMRLMMDRAAFGLARARANAVRPMSLNASDKEFRDWVGTVRREDVTGRYNTVARLKIDAPIMFEPTGWDMFGCIPTDRVVAAINEAAADPLADVIVLELNCPGGSVAGWDDIAQAIRAARAIKPVKALVHDGAYSLAMRMAVMCEEIVATPTAAVGSIGTIVMLYDDSAMFAEAGVIATPVGSDEFKAQGGAGVPLSEEFIAHIRAEIVEPDYAEFVAEVAAARNMTPEAVRALKSLVYPAGKALALGLIDKIENAEAYVATLAAELPQQDPRPAIGDGNGPRGVLNMTVAELKAKFPELTQQIEESAVAGAASEMAAQAAKPATFGELKAEFGADSGFIVWALEGGLTLSAARKQWAAKVNKERAELSAKITAQETRLKELESLPGRGVENAIPAGGTAGKGSDYLSIVKANQAAGMNQGQAHVAAQKSHPALYTAYCQQVGNALRAENV